MKSRVLLIDDSVTIHRVIDLSIDMERYDIVKVFSKEDAALKIQSERYDYILLDNKLDNIIVAEYIKELKAAQPCSSIILLVGAFDRFDGSDLEKVGADDYLVKPFDSQSLNEKLSSDADMMSADIVEKIAEADFVRDKDDCITPTVSRTTGEVIDGLSKKEYLENLEEVQPDDLTDDGYVEDLDNVPTTALDSSMENDSREEEAQIDEVAEDENIIEEIPEEDVIEPAAGEEAVAEEYSNEVIKADEHVEEEITEPVIQNEEPLVLEEAPVEEDIEETLPEDSFVDKLSEVDNIEEADLPNEMHTDDLPLDTDTLEDMEQQYDLSETGSRGETFEEISDVADENNLPVEEMQDNLQVENEPESEESVEMSDMNEVEKETAEADEQEITEEITKPQIDEDEMEETDVADEKEDELLVEEPVLTENKQVVEDIALTDEGQAEEIRNDTPINSDDNIANEDIEAVEQPDNEEIPGMSLLEEVSSIAEEEHRQEDVKVEEPAEEISDNIIGEDIAEDTVLLQNEETEAEIEAEDELAEKEPVVVAEDEYQQAEIEDEHIEEAKQEEEAGVFEPQNVQTQSNFGGISITISRDEIMAILGSAIDKHFLEEAVKDVLASNMKEIVKNIVPAIAEKYIKEEIERLKNDE